MPLKIDQGPGTNSARNIAAAPLRMPLKYSIAIARLADYICQVSRRGPPDSVLQKACLPGNAVVSLIGLQQGILQRRAVVDFIPEIPHELVSTVSYADTICGCYSHSRPGSVASSGGFSFAGC